MTISVPKLKLFCDAWHKCRADHPRECGPGRYAHTGRHTCIYCKTQVWYDGPRPGDES